MTSTGSGPPPRFPPGSRAALGGGRGVFARPARTGVARLAPVVLLLAPGLVVAALRQAACATRGWEGGVPVWRQCGSPLLSSLVDQRAGLGLPGWLTGEVPLVWAPLPAAVTTALATVVSGDGTGQQRGVMVLWLVLSAVVLAGLVVLVGTVHGHPWADPVALALSPVLALTVLLSADLAAVACGVGAVWSWSRRRPELAGALVGLTLLGGRPGVAVLLALAVSPPARVRRAVPRMLVAAGVTVLLVLGPLVAADVGVLTRPLRAWWGGGAQAGSPWFVPVLAGSPLSAGQVAGLAALGMLLALGLVLVAASRRPRPATADLALLGVVVLLLTGPTAPVTAALWLVPLVALAGVGWRDHLLWAGAEVVHAVAWYAWLAATDDPGRGLPAGWYAAALVLRLLAVGRLGWVVWARASWGPAVIAGTLERLPTGPGDGPGPPVGADAYPPVTERP